MTPTEQAARWLADVPTYDLWYEGGTLPVRDAIWMTQAEVLAAIARHLAPGDDLVEQAGKYPEILMGYSQGDMDGVMAIISRQALHEAADTITALLARIAALTAERDEARADRDKWFEGAGAHHVASMKQAQRADQAEAEASRLRDRLARMEEKP